ncbi:MAG: GntR family transcriptional regulator [Lentisphaeria bacterium]|nr:GntR family transcriptional regulator [Lentisphaeria bacterium]
MMDALELDLGTENQALPIYRRVADELRRRIVSGEMPSGSRLPSEAEFSARLGINNRTLRKGLKILSDQGLISQCQGRGTFITYSCPERRMRIGVVSGSSDNFNDLYPMRMLTALEGAVSRSGSAELVLLRFQEPSLEKLLAEINRTGCDGLIVFSAGCRREFFGREFDHIPMVFMNIERQGGVPKNRFHVRLADGAVSAAVDHLHALGHRRIGYIGNTRENLDRRTREFLESVKRLKLSDEYVRLTSREDPAYDIAAEAVASLWKKRRRPTALVCPGVTFAYGAWQGLMLRGVKIPEECSIIGFDINSYTNPHFSSIVQPLVPMAEKAVELLFAQRGCGKVLKQKVYDFPAEIVELGSCASPVR